MAQATLVENAILDNPALAPVGTLPFNDQEIPVYEIDGRAHISGPDLGRILGYKSKNSIANIHKRHADELEVHSRFVRLTTRDGRPRDARTYDEPGAYLVTMFADTPTAKDVRLWLARLPKLARGHVAQRPKEIPEQVALPRLTTAKERNQLVVLVNRYIGAQSTDPSKEAYKQAWRKVHDVMGIKAIEELTVEQLPRAVTFMQALVEALPAGEPQKSLPPARAKFGSMDMLVVSEDVATFSRKKDEFSKELYSAVVAAKSAMRTATRSGGNPRTAAEMLLSEIRALEAQFDATCSAVHMFELALFRVDRIVKIAEAM